MKFCELYSDRVHCSNISVRLLRELLFPPLSTGQNLEPRLPLLNTNTRQLVSETICFLIQDDKQQYKEILSTLADLVVYDSKIETGMDPQFVGSQQLT